MPYFYKINKVKRTAGKRPPPVRADDREALTGWVNGMEASDIEERFARSLEKMRQERRIENYGFRVPYVAGRWMPGSIELDYAVYTGGMVQPVQIDGTYAHKNGNQKAQDSIKDAILNDLLKQVAFPVIRIPGYELETQEEADEQARRLFR